jgi:acyl CoA:acetate/3-ketoacid CoA transferase alpha subunit
MSSKQLDLPEAVRSAMTHGTRVHFSFTHNRSHAAAHELARQLRGSGELHLIGTGLLDYAIVLAAAGAVRTVEGAFAGVTYPTPAPSRSLQQVAMLPGSDPHWTNLTMTLRLMAGALGLPAVSTRSLRGTDLELGAGRARVANPFGDEPIELIAPVRPDVAFVHAPIADTDGNARVEGPYGEELWGAWGAGHVVVTAERVVSPAELRRLGPGPGLPADRVDSVVEAPLGAHPQAQYAWNPATGVTPYAEDYAFRQALREADRDAGSMQAWLDTWVFGSDHDRYLEQLGPHRVARLRFEATDAFTPTQDATSPAADPTRQELAATVAMRSIEEHVRRTGAATLFAGIGLSHLAAWAAARLLSGDDAPQLVAETGMSGLSPVTGDPYLFNFPNSRSAAIHDGFTRMLGSIATRDDRPCLAVLAAGQVDRSGAMNSSTSPTGFIVGSGGANDVGNTGADVLIVMPMTPARTPPHVDFVTTRPRRLVGLATDVGLLEPLSGELTLTGVVADVGADVDAVERARRSCGWDLRVARTVRRLDPPTREELALLRSFDPARHLLG